VLRPCAPVLAALAALAAPVAAGCDLTRDGVPVDAVTIDGLPPPNDHLVPAVGGPDSFDVACWNIENFPKSDRSIELAADLIASLDLDLIVVEEIADVAAWNQLMARLPDHEGVLSSHRYSPTEYQKIGFIYRVGLVTLGEPELLFTGDTYPFPRPPMKLHVDGAGLSFDAIGVHLKAGTASEDAARRAVAVRDLEQLIRAQVDGGGEDEVILLGDYNEVITSAGQTVMAPLLDAPDRYLVRTRAAVDAGERSFLPSGKVIDHVVTTTGLDDEIGATDAIIPELHLMVPRYDADLTDHLPVILSIPTP